MLPALVVLVTLLLAGAVVLAGLAFWIWMLISAIQNRGLSEGEKIAWVLVMIFVHFLGAILYFFIGHPKRCLPLIPPVRV